MELDKLVASSGCFMWIHFHRGVKLYLVLIIYLKVRLCLSHLDFLYVCSLHSSKVSSCDRKISNGKSLLFPLYTDL